MRCAWATCGSSSRSRPRVRGGTGWGWTAAPAPRSTLRQTTAASTPCASWWAPQALGVGGGGCSWRQQLADRAARPGEKRLRASPPSPRCTCTGGAARRGGQPAGCGARVDAAHALRPHGAPQARTLPAGGRALVVWALGRERRSLVAMHMCRQPRALPPPLKCRLPSAPALLHRCLNIYCSRALTPASAALLAATAPCPAAAAMTAPTASAPSPRRLRPRSMLRALGCWMLRRRRGGAGSQARCGPSWPG